MRICRAVSAFTNKRCFITLDERDGNNLFYCTLSTHFLTYTTVAANNSFLLIVVIISNVIGVSHLPCSLCFKDCSKRERVYILQVR